MTESVYLHIGIVLWGAALGLGYFGGLWLTVRRLPAVENQALWMLGSFLIRSALALAGFYAAAVWGWRSVLLCLAGFIGARLIVVRCINAAATKRESKDAVGGSRPPGI